MEQNEHYLRFEHFRTDLGDGLRTGVYFDTCSGTCGKACDPKCILREHPFAQDTKEKHFYQALELVSYLEEEKVWCFSKPLGITFLGREPLSDPMFCYKVGSAVKKAGMALDIWTCGTISKTAFDLLYGIADLFVFQFFSLLPTRNLPYLEPIFDKTMENLLYLDEKCFPYRVRVPVLENVNDTCPGAVAATLSRLQNVKSVILDFSNVSFDDEKRRAYRDEFLKRGVILY